MLLFRLQRLTAALLAPLLLVHLVLTLVLGQSELTAAQLSSQMQSGPGWLIYYGTLVALIGVHAPIGVWQVLRQVAPGPVYLKVAVSVLLGTVIIALGARALWGFYS